MKYKYKGFEGEIWWEEGGYCTDCSNGKVEIPLRRYSAISSSHVIIRIQCLVDDYHAKQN